jgi:hypothetical protein
VDRNYLTHPGRQDFNYTAEIRKKTATQRNSEASKQCALWRMLGAEDERKRVKDAGVAET